MFRLCAPRVTAATLLDWVLTASIMAHFMASLWEPPKWLHKHTGTICSFAVRTFCSDGTVRAWSSVHFLVLWFVDITGPKMRLGDRTFDTDCTIIKYRQVLLWRVVQISWGNSAVLSVHFVALRFCFHLPSYQTSVWKTWQIFLNLKLCQMSKKINKFNFPSVYSVSMREIAFLPLKLNKQMENLIYWSFCSFGRTWGSEISAEFSILVRRYSQCNRKVICLSLC